MKRTIAILMICCLALGLLSGCGAISGGAAQKPANTAAADAKGAGEKKSVSVLTTVFPIYDWTKNIIGSNPGNVKLGLLLDKGVDMHSFRLTAEDVVKIANADVFIFNGGDSDDWVEDALENLAENDKERGIEGDLMKALSGKKIVDLMGSMPADMLLPVPEHDHEHEHEHEHEHDEHIWLSLKNATLCCDAICKVLCDADPENAGAYKKNLENYKAKLSALDGRYKAAVQGAKHKTVVFADRFPFVYLMNDYGITYNAAFSGCSTDVNASFEKVKELTSKLEELGLPAVFKIETGKDDLAKTIINGTKAKDQQILEMNSLQTIKADQVEAGLDYLEIMSRNLESLKLGLGAEK